MGQSFGIAPIPKTPPESSFQLAPPDLWSVVFNQHRSIQDFLEVGLTHQAVFKVARRYKTHNAVKFISTGRAHNYSTLIRQSVKNERNEEKKTRNGFIDCTPIGNQIYGFKVMKDAPKKLPGDATSPIHASRVAHTKKCNLRHICKRMQILS